MTAIDTNVLIDVVEDDPVRAKAALAALDAGAKNGALTIAPAVYAELCAHPGWSPNEVDRYLVSLGIQVDWQPDATIWRTAGVAFGAYARRRKRAGGGAPRRLVADFFIGSHAAFCGAFITRDEAFFKRTFPELRVLAV